MRKMLGIVAAAASLLALSSGTASADSPNEHNCAGVAVSALAGPDLGPLVSGLAGQQQVDNLGLRNCGEANGQNP